MSTLQYAKFGSVVYFIALIDPYGMVRYPDICLGLGIGLMFPRLQEEWNMAAEWLGRRISGN